MTKQAKAAKPAPQSPSAVEFDFREVLEQRNRQTIKKKGDRTQERLKLATAIRLSDMGFRDLKVSDICETAGLSSGTFYIYFLNKVEITRVVLEEFLTHLDTVLSRDTSGRSPFESILHANIRWLRFVRANAGLFRCVLQVSDDSTEIASFLHEINARWYGRITKSALRRYPADASPNEDTLLLAVYSLGSMMDEIARRLIIYPDNAFVSLAARTTEDDKAFAEFLTVIWYRTLFGSVPNAEMSATPNELAKLKLPNSGT